MRRLTIQFRFSFSLHEDEAANRSKNIVINDVDNDQKIVIVLEGQVAKSILFARDDESILCLLEGDAAKLTELANYLLEILDTSDGRRLPRPDAYFYIHAKPNRFSPTRRNRNRISRHSNINAVNVENLTKLNISGPNWNIQPGNSPNERVPSSLSPNRTRNRKNRKSRKN